MLNKLKQLFKDFNPFESSPDRSTSLTLDTEIDTDKLWYARVKEAQIVWEYPLTPGHTVLREALSQAHKLACVQTELERQVQATERQADLKRAARDSMELLDMQKEVLVRKITELNHKLGRCERKIFDGEKF